MDYSEAHILSTTLYYCKVISSSSAWFWNQGWLKSPSAKSSFLRPASGCPLPPSPPCHPLLPTVSFGSSLGNDNFPVHHLSPLSRVKLQNDIHFLLLNFFKRQTMHHSGVLRQILTPDTSDMQTVHFFFLFVQQWDLITLAALHFDYEMHPLSVFTCVLGSSLRFTWLLKCYLSCLRSSGSKIIMDLQKSSLWHPYLSAGMDKQAGRRIQTRDGWGLGKPHYW